MPCASATGWLKAVDGCCLVISYFFLQIGIVAGSLMILFGDLVVGIFQFEYVCHQRTITKLEPGWQEVQRAHSKTAYVQSVNFSAVPISCAVSEFQDKDTGKLFFLCILW